MRVTVKCYLLRNMTTILCSIFREGTLLGLGNPLLDISAVVEPEYLVKHDLKADNAILAEDKHSCIFTEMQEKYKIDYIAGKIDFESN